MFFLGELIAIITFPGVIVHEWSHKKMCDLRNVPVREVCYFRIGNPAGYVAHDEPFYFGDTFLVSMAPFLFSVLLAIGAFSALKLLNSPDNYLTLILFWFGISIGMHAIPSTDDTKIVWYRGIEEVKNRNYLAILSLPIAGIVYILSALQVVWMDLFFALGLYFFVDWVL
jgi:hypothetical protein